MDPVRRKDASERPLAPQSMKHGSDQTKGTSKEAMKSNVENLKTYQQSKRSHAYSMLDKEKEPPAQKINTIGKQIIR